MKRKDSPRRSVLYVPASNAKAMGKIASLSCDAVILDLEDAVGPEEKAGARDNLRAFFSAPPTFAGELVIRINAPSGEWGKDDLDLAAALAPDAVLLPKVDTPRDVLEVGDLLDEHGGAETALWAMVETPKAILNIGAIAELGRDPASRLSCLVAGTNDLVKETGVLATPDRRYLQAWLMQIVLAARAGGLDALDGGSNDFRDLEAFARECAEGAAMGFDGQTLIHPAQIGPAEAAFSPSPEALAAARAVVAAFSLPQNRGKGVLSIDGRMVERLHLSQAERLISRTGDRETAT